MNEKIIATNNDELESQWDALLFGVRRSIRYHLHRRNFFEKLKVCSDFLVIISGGTVAIVANSESEHKTAMNVAVGAFIAIIGSLDLVIGFATKARDYSDLVKEFSELEIEMTASEVTKDALSKFTNKRLKIEEEEPPRMRVLNMYCHNELVRAQDYPAENLANIKFWQSIPKQLFDFFPNRIKTFKQIADEKAKQDAIVASTKVLSPSLTRS